MWADHETNFDLVGFDHLVQAVTNLVRTEALLPASIGVFGDWGSGKSSLLKIVKDKLQTDENTLVIEFNGWLFEGYDDAKTVLMESIIEQIVKERSLTSEVKILAVGLLRRIDWFRAAGRVVRTVGKYGVAAATGGSLAVGALALTEAPQAAQGALEKIGEISEENVDALLESESQKSMQQNILKFREEFAQLLKESDLNRLVVIIDDLDRCLPDTVIDTLEAIKLFLFVDRSAFIIGADERLIKEAVKNRFPDLAGSGSAVSREYLEKLIQYPIRIPELSRPEVESYIGLLFAQLAKISEDEIRACAQWAAKAENIQVGLAFNVSAAEEIIETDLPQDLVKNLAFASKIAPILAPGLKGNPRQCKRFLNMLLMRLEMAKSRGIDLELRALCKLMLLEYLRPQSFKQLAELQSGQDGKPNELKDLEEAVRAPAEPKVTDKKTTPAPHTVPTSGLSPKETKLDGHLGWLNDKLLRDWLALDPSLADVDLRPYFYFARDRLGTLADAAQRLNPQAQQILVRLIDPSEAVRNRTLGALEGLSPVEASAIFQDLTLRARQEEDISAEGSAFKAVFDFVTKRKELAGELITFVKHTPEVTLPISVVPMLKEACEGTDFEGERDELIAQWADSGENKMLQKIAKRRGNNSGDE